MVGIYHSRDLDGWCSGAIIKRKYPDAKLIGYDYGQKLPMEEIPKDEPVIMVDVSLPMYEMAALSYHSKNLTWIDHHISAINDYKNYVEEGKLSYSVNRDKASMLDQYCTPVLENGISACEGAWKYLFQNEEMPRLVKLLGEYDTWRNGDKARWENEILPFQFGMRAICNSVETLPLDLLEPSTSYQVDNIINAGRAILKYISKVNESQCSRNAFEYMFEGRRAICLNGGGFNSDAFNSVYDESKHDIMMPFQFDGKQWTFSLYTTKADVDCSLIAKKHGGGGHQKASGFQKKHLSDVFKYLKEEEGLRVA